MDFNCIRYPFIIWFDFFDYKLDSLNIFNKGNAYLVNFNLTNLLSSLFNICTLLVLVISLKSIYYSCSSCLSINYWLWLNRCRYAGFYAKFIWHVINIKIPRTASELGILLIIFNYFSNAFVSISLSFKNFSTFFCCLPFTLSLYFEFNLSISFVSFLSNFCNFEVN